MEQRLRIVGGHKLGGEVQAAGAKNAVSKMIVASMLCDRRVVLSNVPDILEVDLTLKMCHALGLKSLWDRQQGLLELVTPEVTSSQVPLQFSGSNRVPILLMGALLGRVKGPIEVPAMGGCRIGKRPVDFHLEAFKQMGAQVDRAHLSSGESYIVQNKGRLTGGVITLPYPSVMATENIMLAACRAQGKTVIRNAAIEPEILDLILFLQKLGLVISVGVDRSIYIEGNGRFLDTDHRVMTDRIEAASLGMAAIATEGRLLVKGACQREMMTFLNELRKINGGFTIREEGIEFFYQGPLRGGHHLETDVHPGFLTDWQQPFVVLLTQASGCSVIHETVYENRFKYTETLKEMGADLELFTQCLGSKRCRFGQQDHRHSLVVKGPTRFTAAEITIPDLRAGFAYVMAALTARGESLIEGLNFLDRGYERIDQKLAQAGAQIERIEQTAVAEPDQVICQHG